MTIPIARPLLGDEEAAAAARVVRSGWVLQGPEVQAFEREFAAFVGAARACAVSSGTAALHLALLAVGVRAGDEVVTVSHSFIATANSVRMCGATPVFVDIDATLNLDPALVEAAISPRTRAILCVHQLGLPCDLAALGAIAERRGVALVEDAACAIGSELAVDGEWQRIGRPHTRAACFSFHPRKLVTTGDGGMLTTRDPALDRFARAARQHGVVSTDAPIEVAGFNYRMTDVQAAIGRVQLGRLPDLLSERRIQVGIYRDRLSGIVRFPDTPPYAKPNWQSLCVRLPDGADPLSVGRTLAAEGIATRPGIANAHQQPVYRDEPRVSLPESEAAAARSLMLPLYPGMTREEVERVCASLAAALRPHSSS